MNLYFIFIQIIGFLAWILLALSFHRKTTKKIIFFQLISTVLFSLHYLLLEAYSGLLICILELIRDYLYYKFNKKNTRYVFIGSLIVYVISAFFTYTTVLDVFPYIASSIDGYFLTQKRKKVVWGAIITYVLWFIYDMYALSYSGAITDAIIIISNLSIILFNFNIFDKFFKGNDNLIFFKR